MKPSKVHFLSLRVSQQIEEYLTENNKGCKLNKNNKKQNKQQHSNKNWTLYHQSLGNYESEGQVPHTSYYMEVVHYVFFINRYTAFIPDIRQKNHTLQLSRQYSHLTIQKGIEPHRTGNLYSSSPEFLCNVFEEENKGYHLTRGLSASVLFVPLIIKSRLLIG